MRTINLLLIPILLCLGVLFVMPEEKATRHPSKFLPQDVLLYFEQNEGVKSIEELVQSSLGQVLSGIEYDELMEQFGVSLMSPDQLGQVSRILALTRASEFTQMFLNQRAVVSVFAKRSWYNESDGINGYLKKHLIVIGQAIGGVNSLNDFIDKHLPALTKNTVHFGDHVVFRIGHDGETGFVLSEAHGHILFSFEERVLRETLRLSDEPQHSFNTSPAYEELQRNIKGATSQLYCRVKEIQQNIKMIAAFFPSPNDRVMAYSLTAFPGIETIGYGSSWANNIRNHKVMVELDQNVLQTRIGSMIAPKPTMNLSLPFVPADTLLYYWSNSLELPLLWEMYTERVGANSKASLAVSGGTEAIFGLELKELLQLIGSNIAVLVQDSVIDTFVPIPDFALLVKLKDSQKVATAIEHGLNELNIDMSIGKYREISYSSWGVNPYEAIQPVYTIYRDYLIVANTLNVLKKVLDTPVGSEKMVDSPLFDKLDPGFQTLNNSVCYIDQSRLLYRMRELFSWGGTMIAIQDRRAAEKSKFLLDKLIDPVFSGLTAYEKSATRTYVKDGKIIIESNVLTTH